MARFLPKRRTALTLGACTVAALAAAPSAFADTLIATDWTQPGQVLYFADDTNANRLTVSAVRDGNVNQITFTDPGATNVSFGAGCRQGVTSAQFVCTTPSPADIGHVAVQILTLGGNDSVTVDGSVATLDRRSDPTSGQSASVEVEGGDGNDTLVTKADWWHTSLIGGAGNDYLKGGVGNDTLSGDAGDDILLGAEGSDRIYGGAGTDTMTYVDGRTSGVIVYLLDDGATTKRYSGGAVDFDSMESPGDLIYGVERLYGTSQPDVLIGNSADNLLYGGGGTASDQLLGLAGNDTLTANGGASKLSGGDGNDTLNARNGVADSRLDCGAGTDSANLDLLDAGWTGCENVARQ